MFNFLHPKQTQSERVLELLIKHGKVTSLQLSQVHPVILNFHNCIFNLRQFHNIRVESKIVKWKKHTTYFYEGRKFVPMPREKIRYYTKEEMIECWNTCERKDFPNVEAYLQTI